MSVTFPPRPWALIGVVLVALGSGLALSGPAEARKGRNVIVVMTDDQNFSDMRVMKKTRRLIGRRGATFENFFVSYSLCCPSRATLFSGQYAHNNRVLGNGRLEDGKGGYPAQIRKRRTLPTWFKRAGYRTGHIGKYLNRYGGGKPGRGNSLTSIPPGWTDWMGTPGNNTYRMYDYNLNVNGRLKRFGSSPRNYQTDVLRRLATRFIARNRKKRFFLSVAPLAPHSEGRRGKGWVPPRPARRDRRARVPAFDPPPSFDEADMTDKPGWLNGKKPLGQSRGDDLARLYRARLRSLLAVDDLVQGIYRQLARSGLLDETYVIFTSDNGYLFGEHRLTQKNWHYQEATHMPLLIRGPGVRRGRNIEALAANVDLAPTIARMAGVRPRLRQDGVSLMPLLRGTRSSVRNDLLFESFEGHDKTRGGALRLFGKGTHRGLRTLRYSYIEYFDGSRELYDNFTDPFQLDNLYDPAATGELATLQEGFAARLRRLARCRGARCR